MKFYLIYSKKLKSYYVGRSYRGKDSFVATWGKTGKLYSSEKRVTTALKKLVKCWDIDDTTVITLETVGSESGSKLLPEEVVAKILKIKTKQK